MFKQIAKKIRSFFEQKIRADLLPANHGISELLWAVKFNSLSNGVEWFKYRSLAPSGAAANYSFLYMLFWILEYVKPARILEIGMGQSTIVLSQYVAYNDMAEELCVVESDELWLSRMEKRFPQSSKIKMNLLPEAYYLHAGYESRCYKGIKELFQNKKFNLFILDGPGEISKRFGRAGFADLLPHALADEFIIIIDDYSNDSIRESINLFSDILTKNGVKFFSFTRGGLRSQCIIASPCYSFLTSI